MAGSYEQINYTLRPAKNIERKMLAEALSRLAAFSPLQHYQYVGLGSTFFSDFTLFHRTLGIERMISIEQDHHKKDRFIFNRPYNCIEVHFGKSNDLLPSIPWAEPLIVWMDYDSKPSQGILIDLAHFCRHAIHGSAMIVSVNVHNLTLKALRRHLGEEKIPDGVSPASLMEWGGANVCRDILANEIMDRLNERNGTLGVGDKLEFRQLFNFRYRDGARILTFGGILFRSAGLDQLGRCSFGNLAFIREGPEPYEIEVPVLTLQEIRGIDSELPGGDMNKFIEMGIPERDLEKYKRIYRYFPRFTEAEI